MRYRLEGVSLYMECVYVCTYVCMYVHAQKLHIIIIIITDYNIVRTMIKICMEIIIIMHSTYCSVGVHTYLPTYLPMYLTFFSPCCLFRLKRNVLMSWLSTDHPPSFYPF